MSITPLPPAPSRTDPLNFSQRADDLLAALPTFVTEANALENSVIASVSSATSSSSITVSTGVKNITVQTGKSFTPNSWVSIVCTTDPSKALLAQVVSYNSATGALSVNVTATTGSGTATNWFVHYTSPQTILTQQAGLATLDANTFTGAQTLPGNATSNLHAVPKQQLDSGLANKALLAGSGSQVFSVAAATAAEHATRLGQFLATVSGSDFSLEIPCSGLPAGATKLIIKIGKVTSAADNSFTTVTFPAAFPNVCFGVYVTTLRGAALAADSVISSFGHIIDRTQIAIGVCANAAISSPDVQWIAIGY